MAQKVIHLPFSVSARTARLIGRENVSNADGAIIELVKNCHDADALDSCVYFNGDNLLIIDNGHGMTEEDIRKKWMVIGTDNKDTHPLTPEGRIKAGAKGIGRFALDRLGEHVEMITVPRGSKSGYKWSIDWSNFDKKSATVDEITASLEEASKNSLAKKIASYNKLKDFAFSDGGTILHIKKLRDEWSEDQLEKLYKNLETLVPPSNERYFSVSLFASAYPEKYGSVESLINEDFDHRLTANYSSERQEVDFSIERNELDPILLEKKHKDVFNTKLMKESPYKLEDFKKGSFSERVSVYDLLSGYKDEKGLLKKLGDFKFTVMLAKQGDPGKEDKEKYPYKTFDYASRKEWWKRFGGIKIFRDNFRVRPYGEFGEDWLKLGGRAAQSPAGAGQSLGGYRVRPNQVSGSLIISRIQNTLLQDKSSREGLQENESFTLLKELLVAIISKLEEDRNTVMYSLNLLYKKKNQEELKKEKGKEAADKVKKASSSKLKQVDIEVAENLAEAHQVLESENKDKNEEIKVLRSLASAGLVMAAVAHELKGLENILATRIHDLRKLLKPFITEKDTKKLKEAFNPYILISEMEQTDTNLQDWIKYALMPLKRDRRKRRTVYLFEYFEYLTSIWSNILKDRKIGLDIAKIDDSFKLKIFTIDLDTIFNNLIINSIESFVRQKSNNKRKISISCRKRNGFFDIEFSDNAAGLDKSFRKNPEVIFLPEKTSKRDAKGNIVGTGMGMYLLKSVVDENNGQVEITQISKGFALVISLPK